MEFEERLGAKLEYGISGIAKIRKWRTKRQIKKRTQKWVFDLAKHGLNKTWDLSKIWSHFWEDKTVERKIEKKRKMKRRRREEEVKPKPKRYGTTWKSDSCHSRGAGINKIYT